MRPAHPLYIFQDFMKMMARVTCIVMRRKLIRAPVNASVIIACDYDKDGHLDLFIGGRSVPGTYGVSPESYVMHNDGKGNFTDVSKQVLGR
jgi:hypothetical protein